MSSRSPSSNRTTTSSSPSSTPWTCFPSEDTTSPLARRSSVLPPVLPLPTPNDTVSYCPSPSPSPLALALALAQPQPTLYPTAILTSSYTGFFCNSALYYLILPHLAAAPLSTPSYVVSYCHPMWMRLAVVGEGRTGWGGKRIQRRMGLDEVGWGRLR